jgi:hypothetical protein
MCGAVAATMRIHLMLKEHTGTVAHILLPPMNTKILHSAPTSTLRQSIVVATGATGATVTLATGAVALQIGLAPTKAAVASAQQAGLSFGTTASLSSAASAASRALKLLPLGTFAMTVITEGLLQLQPAHATPGIMRCTCCWTCLGLLGIQR